MSETVNINIPFSKKNHEMLRELSFYTRLSINKLVNTVCEENLPEKLRKAKESKESK